MAFFVIFKSYLVENEGVENFALRDHLPLQQGLRPTLSETLVPFYEDSETIFHYNKD